MSTTIALDWLGREMTTAGGTLPGFTAGSTDFGLTADAVLAFVAAGRGGDPAAQVATDLLAARSAEFTTWDLVGPDHRGVRLVGPTAKLVLVLESQQRQAVGGDGADLVAELRSLLTTSGADAGRFVDRNPHGPESTNGFGQALAMMALAMVDGTAPSESVAYLLDQQCPDGGFRLFYVDTHGCESSDGSDPDTTAMAVQALLGTTRTTEVADALSSAVGWLASRQDPVTGGFGGSGPTASINANSTGLAAQTLRAVGATDAADAAAEWVTGSLQLTAANAGPTPAAPHIGAIAHTDTARTSALATGVAAVEVDQWRRSTTQAVLALGLARFADTGPVTPVTPVDPPVTTTTSTTTPTTPTTPTSATPTSTTRPTTPTPSTSAPTEPIPTTQPIPMQPTATGSTHDSVTPAGDAAVLSTGQSSGAAARPGAGPTTATSTLARTGSDPWRSITLGLALLAAGTVLLASRRRGAR